jgi:hypothetical protein
MRTWSPADFRAMRARRDITIDALRGRIRSEEGRAPSASSVIEWCKDGSAGPRDLKMLAALARALECRPEELTMEVEV